ncbi:MAG: HAMP domain-containing histidine kinase [Bacteriovoracaceae bacterium]|nr:HAMP domain-containing histidine kinase [Bacteriovoracaceae bacterium]
MTRSRWWIHPLTIFIFSLLALFTSLYLYIHSYLRVNEAFEAFIVKHKLNPSVMYDSQAWVMILTLSILVSLIIIGMILIYVYYQKMRILYRQQQNFINGFTHELKTPVASLKLFLETFTKHELTRDQQLKYLNFMKRDTERLSDNVSLILNLAKIEDKDQLEESVFTDLGIFITEFLDNSPHLFDEIDIQFENRIKGPTSFPVNRNMMEMLLMNMVTNAIRYNDLEDRKLDIIMRRADNFIEIVFKDNGIGINKSEQKKIFKKFYQVGKTAKGSGLGLYFVQQIVKLHKGSIRVYSEGLGKGCSFILELPSKLEQTGVARDGYQESTSH